MSIRSEKVASVIKRSLTMAVSTLAAEKGFGFASISTIQLSKDLSVASIFVNLFTNKNNKKEETIYKFLNILNDNKGRLRSIVAREVQMRSTPDLRFYYDDTLDQMQQVDNLLNKIKTNFPYKENYGDEDVYKND